MKKKLKFKDIFSGEYINDDENNKENRIMTDLHNITCKKNKKEGINIEELISQNTNKVNNIMENNINSILMNSLLNEKSAEENNNLSLLKNAKSGFKFKKLNRKDDNIFRLTSNNNFSLSNLSDLKVRNNIKTTTTFNKLSFQNLNKKSNFFKNKEQINKSNNPLLTIDSNNTSYKPVLNNSLRNNNFKQISRNEKILDFRTTGELDKNINSNYNSLKDSKIDINSKRYDITCDDEIIFLKNSKSQIKNKFNPKLYFKEKKLNDEIDYVKRKFVYLDILKKVDIIQNKCISKEEINNENLDDLRNFPKKSNLDIRSNLQNFENKYNILFQEKTDGLLNKHNASVEKELDEELVGNLKKNLKIKNIEDKFHFLVDKVKLDKDKIQKHTFITSNIAKVISYTDVISKMKDDRILKFGENIKETYSNYSKKIGLEKEFSEKEYLTYNTNKAFSNLTKEKIQSSHLKRRMAELANN